MRTLWSEMFHRVALGICSWSYYSTTSVGETSDYKLLFFPGLSLGVSGFLYTEAACSVYFTGEIFPRTVFLEL